MIGVRSITFMLLNRLHNQVDHKKKKIEKRKYKKKIQEKKKKETNKTE
jgi:hypothetical protein